jgi:energy-converting hydrogenase Eha subunit C
MMIFEKPRLMGLAVVLGLFAILMRTNELGQLLSITALIIGIISIIQEYQRLKKRP